MDRGTVTMFSSIPPGPRGRLQAVIVAAWGAFAVSGGMAIVFPPGPETRGWASLPILMFGSMMLSAGVFAAVGVLADRYRWEWVAAWLGGLAYAPLAVLEIVEVIRSGSGQSWTLALALAFVVLLYPLTRAQWCSGHASKLREIQKDESV